MSVVNGPRFRAELATITALVTFWRAAKSAAVSINKEIAKGNLVIPPTPIVVNVPKTTRIGFDFKATMKDGTFKTFYNFIADVPYGASSEDIRIAMDEVALNVKSMRYEIELVHTIVRTAYSE